MRYCKVRSIESLNNEYGFTSHSDCETINLNLYAEKGIISQFSGKRFCMPSTDDCSKFDGVIVYDTGRGVLLHNSDRIRYNFLYCMLVGGGVMYSDEYPSE